MKYNLFTLSELATIKYGKNQKKVQSDSGTVPIYGTGGLMGYASKALYNKPSVLIGRKGSINKVRYADIPFWTVDTLFYTEVNENIVFPKYLYYLMSLLDLGSYNEGTTIPSLRTETLNRLEFYIPNLDYQSIVLSMLEPIDRQIELNKEINDNLQQQALSIFQEWFIDNPDKTNWHQGTFSELVQSTLNGDWGKESPSGNNIQKVYCIRGADIPDVRAGSKGKMPIRYILPKNYASKMLTDGDIVIEISGGSPTQSTGRCVAVTQSLLERYDSGMVCTNFCKAIKPKSNYSMFIYYYWQYLYDKKVFFAYENGTTGIKNLDFSGFLETENIVIPPEELVSKFNNYCKAVFDQVFANGKESEKLAEIRDYLLPRLMSGELDISNIVL
jgi:type I restriction enzyme S subunit